MIRLLACCERQSAEGSAVCGHLDSARCRRGRCARSRARDLVIVNMSFNVRGEPIVCTPADSYRCFMRTEMDYLVLESFVLSKEASRKVAKFTQSRKD